ncbi:MAG TPA: bifunctional DNA-formamidopyrimidine glycosylase/DNA-(apurinic or apyrimidinic site) lyase [Candidatus Paceibacterota bacterium]|nr:bifunctional DNA-formamidopyrimidine glycosylase/DNA-(apurinic or apyrimidinic site) lyase [Candidatus Paceibacterota bacterium]
MPELPEVETTVQGLRNTVVGLTIKDVWTDLASTDKRNTESVKNPKYFTEFKKKVTGQKIVRAERRAKNILLFLKNNTVILIHMKMTGHLLYGLYAHDKKKNVWIPDPKEKNEALRDPFNKFLRVVFTFTNGKHLVFSDLRKFGKITLLEEAEKIHDTKHLQGIGPEPLNKLFTETLFTTQLLRRPRAKIKQALMDQSLIAGIGNIYSDEALWLAGIHPLSPAAAIPKEKMKALYRAVQTVLTKGIDFGGDSMSDYRDIYGNRGTFQNAHNAYRRTGKPCTKRGCSGTIARVVVGGRSAHFCGTHQKLYT